MTNVCLIVYGCGNIFRLNTALVTKPRREFIKDGAKLRYSPANIYFHIQVNNALHCLRVCATENALISNESCAYLCRCH